MAASNRIQQSPSGPIRASTTIQDGVLPGDKAVWDGTQWIPDQSTGWAAQAAWFVDSVNGLDTDDGATSATAIKTLAELAKRLGGAALAQNTTITLSGNFSAEDLTLDLALAGGTYLAIEGTPTTLYSGTIVAKTDAVPGTNAPDFTDPGLDSTLYTNARVRLTAGVQAGATAFILKALGAHQARVTQWTLDGLNPINATLDSYVVEQLTSVRSVSVRCVGLGDSSKSYVYIDSVEILDQVASQEEVQIVFRHSVLTSGQSILSSSGGFGIAMWGCYATGSLYAYGYFYLHCCGTGQNGRISVGVQSYLSSTYGLFQGWFDAMGVLLFEQDNGIQDNTQPQSIYVAWSATLANYGTLWGVNDGPIHLESPARLVYLNSKPTLTDLAGHGPVIGGNQIDWGSVPLAISGSAVLKADTTLPDALEVPFSIIDPATTAAVNFPAGVTLNGTAYQVEVVELAPAGGTPAPSSGVWATAKTTTGFTANVSAAPGAGVTRNFIARIKN